MSLTLSVGFVVDDAIVMLENIIRHVEAGEPAHEAAMKGSREIGFTILSMTISLAAVFIPDRVHGRHHRPPAARICGDHHPCHRVLRPRLHHANADAVQPHAAQLRKARRTTRSTAGASAHSTACSRSTNGRCAGAWSIAPQSLRCSWQASWPLSVCSTSCRRISCPRDDTSALRATD